MKNKNLKINKMLSFEIGIVEHCNLNCVGCAHFAPLADEYYMDINRYIKDISQLSNIFSKKAKWIHIMGGEPILHPQIELFLTNTRRYFPSAKIRLITNGKAYEKLTDYFWKVCRESNIIISPTVYPCEIDYIGFKRKAKENNVNFKYYNSPKEEKLMNKYVLDLNGNQDMFSSFCLCDQANQYITLKEGKLFTCPTIAYINNFNQYFDCNLIVDKTDYINIYEITKAEDIFTKLASPTKFCRYCNIKEMKNDIKWNVSAKEINEWLL